MLCSCCGEEREPETLAALVCHEDVKVCRECAGWLIRRAGGVDVTPTLPVTNMRDAVAFYERAGFDVRPYDEGFAFVTLADQSVFDLDLNDRIHPDTNGAGCYIITANVDEWHERLRAEGLPVSAVADQPWNMHEFTLTDPSGNHIRIGCNTG